jgi:hypothetical protein
MELPISWQIIFSIFQRFSFVYFAQHTIFVFFQMTHFKEDCCDQPWMVGNDGVVSVSNRRAGESGTHTFAVHGLVVAAKYIEVEGEAATVISTGGYLALVVSDVLGKRRSMTVSKNNLCLTMVKKTDRGKFMSSMLQVKAKDEGPISGKIFWGTFCWSGCLRYETSFCGLRVVICARLYRLVSAFFLPSFGLFFSCCARWQQDADRN